MLNFDNDVILCEQIWDVMFSNAAMGIECPRTESNKRAIGIPGIMNAIAIRPTTTMNELGVSPSILIGYLWSIGWAGRYEFAARLKIAYSQHVLNSGG